MIFAGLIISAVTVFLGVFTKFPQGAGFLPNNLTVMSFLFSNPPVSPPPPPPPKAILFDLNAAILETRQFYTRHPLSAGNVTEGPMPSPLAKPRAPSGSKTALNSTFSFPNFSFPAFPLPLHFFQLCFTVGETVARIAMAVFVLCLPWITARRIHLLDMTVSAQNAAARSLIIDTGFEHKLWQIQPQNPLFDEAVDNKRHQDEKHSLNMGRERERDSWKEQEERLEMEKKRENEGMEMKLNDILKEMKKEREGWAKEREGWNKDKAELAREKKKIEAGRKKLKEKTKEEKKSWEEANDRAQRRIVELEDENETLANEAAEKKKLDIEREAAIKTSEEARAEERKRREEELQTEAKKKTSKLEEEVLNGRKLIEDLQGDKRRDRQLLLELRAQLVRPTHAAPPTHMNPLRFGGSAQPAMEGSVVVSPSAATYAIPSTCPRANVPPILPSNPPPVPSSPILFGKVVNQVVDVPIIPLPPGPIVRLPPPSQLRQMIPAQQLPAPSLVPPNAPKGPKGWMSGPSGGHDRRK